MKHNKRFFCKRSICFDTKNLCEKYKTKNKNEYILCISIINSRWVEIIPIRWSDPKLNGLNGWIGNMKWMNALAIHKRRTKKKQNKLCSIWRRRRRRRIQSILHQPNNTRCSPEKYDYVIAFVGAKLRNNNKPRKESQVIYRVDVPTLLTDIRNVCRIVKVCANTFTHIYCVRMRGMALEQSILF